MRNEILIPSAVTSNVYFLGPMGDPDPSDFIRQETNQIPFKQSTMICSLGMPKLPSEIGPKCLRDGEIGSVGCLIKRVEIGSFMF